VLIATELYKRFGALEVLKGVSISLQKGELATIVGPSGCGKSTLLHILGTLDTPDKGQITMNGTDFSNLKGKQLAAFRNKHIGFVFQFHHLLPEFNALENVSIPAWIAGRKRNEVKQAATELLKKMGLENRLTHKPSELSGGEQQRVAVARALINKPSVVLADEPTGNLDSAHARELHQLFISLKNELGQSFLIVTHNEELAAKSDRVWSMRDGQII
jgi:lipoprotein-releasing system ATP-binding protein